MNNSEIPSWFYKEHEEKNIWNPPFDYEQIGEEINEIQSGLTNGWKETEVQNYLKEKPYLFDGLYRHGHGTFVMSEKGLAGAYRIDWLIGNGHSGGICWELIELECPQSKPFNKDGHFSKATRKGINQIRDWRLWIGQNIDSAQREKSRDGLGLYDITNHAHGIVVVGRRDIYKNGDGHDKYNRLRNDSNAREGIEIISYDSLLEKMRFYVNRSG